MSGNSPPALFYFTLELVTLLPLPTNVRFNQKQEISCPRLFERKIPKRGYDRKISRLEWLRSRSSPEQLSIFYGHSLGKNIYLEYCIQLLLGSPLQSVPETNSTISFNCSLRILIIPALTYLIQIAYPVMMARITLLSYTHLGSPYSNCKPKPFIAFGL